MCSMRRVLSVVVPLMASLGWDRAEREAGLLELTGGEESRQRGRRGYHIEWASACGTRRGVTGITVGQQRAGGHQAGGHQRSGCCRIFC
jgi:hypothetical protein